MSLKALGIYRETLHSPEREFDDREILRLTGEELKSQGLDVTLAKPEDLTDAAWWSEPKYDFVFIMCEKEAILKRLEAWERKGVTVVNPIQGIWNTYRFNTLDRVQSAKVPFPKSQLVSTAGDPSAELKNFEQGGAFVPLWIKRGDVHNTQKGDVTLARSLDEVKGLFASFQTRGIAQAVLQDHLEGDLVKFYGVGSNGQDVWHRWFYHKAQDLKKYPFHEPTLKKVFFSGAQALNLEVFGGDAVVTPKGEVFLIDLNAWPSFALFRDHASKAIARHLLSKLTVKSA